MGDKRIRFPSFLSKGFLFYQPSKTKSKIEKRIIIKVLLSL